MAVAVGLVVGEPVDRGPAVLGDRDVERDGCEAALGLQCLGHVGLGQVELVGQLGRRRRGAALLAVPVGVDDLGLDLLDPAGRPDGPAVVAEVPLDLTGDRGHGVGQEVALLGDVELLGGAGQRHAGDLLEVLDRDGPVAVAVGDRVGDADVEDDDLLEQVVTLLPRGPRGVREEPSSLLTPHDARRRAVQNRDGHATGPPPWEGPKPGQAEFHPCGWNHIDEVCGAARGN